MSEKKERCLSVSEQKAIEARRSLLSANHNLFCLNETEGEMKQIALNYIKDLSEDDAQAEHNARVCATTGCHDERVGLALISKTCEAIMKSQDSVDSLLTDLNKIGRAMCSMKPRDEIEGHLIAQIVVLQEQSMSWLGRAQKTERVDFANTYLNGASKLLTRHHEAVAALMKYRRGGDQRVYVEHVHVNDGGKAIVGNVGPRGGLNQINEEGPHAKV